MIVTADLHLREETEDVIFDEVLPGLVSTAVSRIETSVIAILGDIYHIRYRVSVRLQNRLFNFLESAQVYWILLPGNHDQINPQGENALEVFRELKNVEVKSRPGWDKRGLWIPYRKNQADIQRSLTMTKPEDCPAIAWLHHGVRGAYMNNQIQDHEGLYLESFAGFQRVYCGHYHKPQDLGNVRYIGSPYQTRADESGQQKYIGIWNGPDTDMQMVEVNWGRRFQRIAIGPDDTPDFSQFGKDDELRVQVDGQSPEEVGKALAALGFTHVTVTPVQKATEVRLQVDPSKGLTAYAQGYVDQFAGELDSKKLMDLWQEITT